MESIIELLLNNKIEAKELVSWLNSSAQVTLLNQFDHLKYDFVPLFLNCLRDQTTSFLLSSGHTGLTPNKSKHLKVSKYISPSKLSRKPYPNRGFSSKAKTLDFSATSDVPANDYNRYVADSLPCQGRSPVEINSTHAFPAITPKKCSTQVDPSCNDSPVSFQSHKTLYNTSTPRNFNTSTPRVDLYKTQPKKHFGGERNQGGDSPQFNSGVPMSQRKNVLSDYILIEHSKKKVPKKKGSRDSQKEWNYQTDVKEIDEEMFNIEDKEVFPLVGSDLSVKGEQRKRRINPTRVVLAASNQSSSSVETSRGFGVPRKQITQNVFLSATETKTKSLDQERRLLKEEKEKLQKYVSESSKLCTSKGSPDTSFNSSLSSVKSSPSTVDEENTPSLKQVTTRPELNTLAQIYSSLILYNMVPNIMVELYFLLQLMTVEKTKVNVDHSSSIEFAILISNHNCVYFSIKTLSLLVDCLALFDRSFLRALTENARVLRFDAGFQERLTRLMDSSASVRPAYPVHPKSPILSVSFQSETDNRNNFPTTTAFQIFKKQRDLFYELLRIWEDTHLTPGWSFAQGLGSKVRQIVSLQSDPTNLIHLARLFQSQLLTMCKGDEQLNAPKDAEDISFLCQLKKQHPEKYKKLYDRLITPSKFGGPVPGPSFPGSQEFFRSFIMVASNHFFNIHLKNVLVAKITEFNNLDWQILDIEEKEQHCEHLRTELSSTLQNLRLLAKYLGLLEFLPYQTSEALPDVIIGNQLMLRNKVSPPLPLLDMLKEGVRSGCLVAVVPWVVELLSMVDAVALHTRHYLTLVFALKLVYKLLYLFNLDGTRNYGCRSCAQLCQLRSVSPVNSLFLKLLLGWLLSLPNVPEGLFYVHEEEADIDMKEFQSFRSLLASLYTQLCPECASNLDQRKRLNFLETEDGAEALSPIKAFSSATPSKNGGAKTPLKGHGYDISPLKTPSKFLQVSMIDTPEVTPDKRGDEEDPRGAGEQANPEFILDSFNLVDCNIMLMTCPFVHELRGVLHDFALGHARAANGGSVRKITPLAAPDKVNESAHKSVQLLLEESFFHNQPSSTKKAVDFVVERLFSRVLRSIRAIIIPKLKDGCVNQLRAVAATSMATSPLEKVVEIIDRKVHQLSSELSSQTRSEIMVHMNEMLGNGDLNTSLQFLLPGDVTENSLDMCCKIVRNTVRERVSGWIASHLATGFCTKELTTEVYKYIKQIQKTQPPSESPLCNASVTSASNTSVSNLDNSSSAAFNITLLEDPSLDLSVTLPNGHTSQSGFSTSQTEASIFPFKTVLPHNEALLSPSSMLYEIKLEVKSLMLFAADGERDGEVDLDVPARFLQLRRTLLERHDVTLPMFKALETLSVDWMVSLCVCRPQAVTRESLRSFVSLWLPPALGGHFPKPAILTVFLSARTVMLLGQRSEGDQKRSWAKLEEVLFEIFITHKVLSLSQLQEPFVALMRHVWPQTILNGISTLIKNFIDVLRKQKDFNDDSDLLQFVDWVGWVTAEMDHLEDWD